MSTTVIDPPVWVATPPPARRRHIFRRVAAGIILLFLIAGFAYAETYQPLVANGGGLYSVNGPEGSNVVAGASGNSLGTIRYRDGAIEIWGIDIRNDGRFAVSITGAQWHGPVSPFGKVSVELATPAVDSGSAHIGPATGLQPLQPFTLGQGQQRTIYVRFLMSGCSVPSTNVREPMVYFAVSSLTLESRAFVVPRATTIFTPQAGFQIAVPADASCMQSDGSIKPANQSTVAPHY